MRGSADAPTMQPDRQPTAPTAKATVPRRGIGLGLALLMAALPLVSAGMGSERPTDLGTPTLLAADPPGPTVQPGQGGNGLVSNEAIGPGSQLLIQYEPGGAWFGCTANWVWKDQFGNLYLGSAGHCFLPEKPVKRTSTHGPDKDFNASSVVVYACRSACYAGGYTGGVAGELEAGLLLPPGPGNLLGPNGFLFSTLPGEWARLGPVAYARRMQAGVEEGNDFGLVVIPQAEVPNVNPAMPFWGGPKGPASDPLGDIAVLHGNGAILAETFLTKSRSGTFTSYGDNVWKATVPVAGGDSGAPVGQVIDEGLDTDFTNVLAAGLQTHGDGDCVDGDGVVPDMNGDAIVAKVYCSTIGTTLARAIEMAEEADLCLKLVLQGQDPATVAAPTGACLA